MDVDDLRDLTLRMGLQAPRHSVVTGSLPNFLAAVERRTGPLEKVGSADRLWTHMGIQIQEHPLVPPNRALLKQGDDVIAVINLD